jgi:hypothetical protein
MSDAEQGHAQDISAILDEHEREGIDVSGPRETLYEDLAEELEAAADDLDRAAIRAPASVESRLRDCEVDLREIARVLETADGRLTDGEIADRMYRDEIRGDA